MCNIAPRFNNLGKVAHKSRRTPPPDVLGAGAPTNRSRSNSPEPISAIVIKQNNPPANSNSIVSIATDTPAGTDLSRVAPEKPPASSSNNASAGTNPGTPGQGDMTQNAQSPRGSPVSRPSSPRTAAAGGYAASGRPAGTATSASPQSSGRQASSIFPVGN